MRCKTTLWVSLLVAMLAAFLNSSAFAADPSKQEFPLANLFERDRQDLSGEWKYLVDPFDNVFKKDQTIKINDRYNFFNDDKASTPRKLIEYEWASAGSLDVPGDWNTQRPELEFYEGTLWYKRNFNAKLKQGRRYFLYFEAANYRTHVFLNKTLVGRHVGGYTPFAFDVTELVKKKDNLLVVAVNNERSANAIPATATDWWNYGGITRPVHLVSVPETYIHHYELSYSAEGGGQVSGMVKLKGSQSAGQPVRISVKGLDVDLESNTDADGIASFDFPAKDTRLWSPESPYLYSVSIKSPFDYTEDKIGFRTIAVKGSDILLNGKPVYLRGISIHEEPIGPKGGRKINEKSARALLQASKDLGANFVRLAHYPHTELTTRLADEMGLMVWSEVPIYWGINFDNPEMLRLGELMLRENINRDINRASIVVWGVANETPVGASRNRYLRALIDVVRDADPSRLVSAALMKNKQHVANGVLVDDPLSHDLDIVAVNEYEGWYGPRTLDEVPDIKWKINSDKPLFFSEFGAGALAGYRGGEDVRWTEEYQAKFYAQTLKMVSKIPNTRGMSPWVLKDFRSPRRYHQRYQEFWNRKGLIDQNGKQKLAFDVLRDYYEAKAQETTR